MVALNFRKPGLGQSKSVAGESPVATVESTVRRVDVVDLGRGAIMALMALDHTRTFLTNVAYNPSDLTRTFPSLFLTRWVSHFCTPLFLFLAGAGVFFVVGHRDRSQAAGRLVTRGFVLIVLELTVVRWGWYFNLDYRHTSLQVLWAIGASMILMAPLIMLPPRVVGAIGLAIVALHNAVSPIVRDSPIGESWPWALLYERGRVLTLAPDVSITVNFPVLPLFGIMAMGYAFGEVWRWQSADRRRGCLIAGIACLAFFIVLRLPNLYGDPMPWTKQATPVLTALSILVLTKHPLSLSMALATLGPALIWMGLVRPERPIWHGLIAIGRVPMLFYLLHVPLIHLAACVYSWTAMGHVGWLFTSPFDRGAVSVPTGWGLGLPAIYASTLVLLAALYPVCRRYADLKIGSRSAWLSYL